MATRPDSTTDWPLIWEQKGAIHLDSYDHSTLLALDGFDVGAGQLTSAASLALAEAARERLGLRAGMTLLEVGCGAGAFLWGFRGVGLRLVGIDSSPSLIEHARRAIPEGTFAVTEAVDLPFEADAIVSFAVFHYFPSYAYAARVLAACRQRAPIALVLDIPDLATRLRSERARAELGSAPSHHLYYPRSFFAGAEIWASEIPGYGNAPYRYNALMRWQTERG